MVVTPASMSIPAVSGWWQVLKVVRGCAITQDQEARENQGRERKDMAKAVGSEGLLPKTLWTMRLHFCQSLHKSNFFSLNSQKVSFVSFFFFGTVRGFTCFTTKAGATPSSPWLN